MTDEKSVSVRDSMRATMFHTNTPKSSEFSLNGVKLEFRQPKLGAFVDTQSDSRSPMIMLMINHSYIPGTSEKFFDDADYDSLRDLPMSSEVTEAFKLISETMNLKVDDKAKNS